MARRDATSAMKKITRAQRNDESVIRRAVEHVPGQEALPGTTPPKATRKREKAAPTGTRFVGFSIDPALFDRARSAYVEQFYDAPEADRIGTFKEWVTRAVIEHMGRTAQQRAAITTPTSEARQISRQVAMPVSVLDQLDDTRTRDGCETRNHVSRSVFITAALAAAADRVEERVGTLPPPPPSLPTQGMK